MIIEPGPEDWLSLVDDINGFLDVITPSVTSKVLFRFIDTALLMSFDDTPFDPKAMSDMIRFSGCGVA